MSELAAGYDVAELSGAGTAAVYDVASPDVIAALEQLGYSVTAFEHGLHEAGTPPRVSYRVSGFGLERERTAPLELETLLETHSSRVELLELVDVRNEHELALREQLEQGLEQIEQQLAIVTSANVTAAQLRAAVAFTLRALRALARLELRELDEPVA